MPVSMKIFGILLLLVFITSILLVENRGQNTVFSNIREYWYLTPVFAIFSGSMTLLNQARKGIPRISNSDIIEYEKAWRDASFNAIRKIVQTANDNVIPIDMMKLFFRVVSDNDKQKLCEILLKGFAKEFDYSTAQVWKSNYRIKYPH